MDTVFWTGLGLGALISVPLSITANLWTDKVRDYLDKRRKIRLSNRKSKEVRTYFFVRALVEGNPVAKVMFDMNVAESARMLLFATIAFVGIVFLALLSSDPRTVPYKPHMLWLGYIVSAWAIITYLISSYLHLFNSQVERRTRRFKQYEDSIREKWGDDALEEALNKEWETYRN